jgi:hypothetical protein
LTPLGQGGGAVLLEDVIEMEARTGQLACGVPRRTRGGSVRENLMRAEFE